MAGPRCREIIGGGHRWRGGAGARRRKGEVSDIRRQAGEGLRARLRLRAVTLGPVALVVLLLLAWSSANEGGAVQRREARA